VRSEGKKKNSRLCREQEAFAICGGGKGEDSATTPSSGGEKDGEKTPFCRPPGKCSLHERRGGGKKKKKHQIDADAYPPLARLIFLSLRSPATPTNQRALGQWGGRKRAVFRDEQGEKIHDALGSVALISERGEKKGKVRAGGKKRMHFLG